MKKTKFKIVNKKGYKFTSELMRQLRLADAECDDPNNLVSHEEAVSQIESWLNRTPKEKAKRLNLTLQQLKELDEAIAETYDPTKLIDHEVVMKKYEKWLN